MTFTFVDVILIVVFFGFVFGGFALGLIRSVGAIVGLALGTWVAGRYFMPLADWLSPLIGGNSSAANIVSFLIIFCLANRLTVLAFHLLDKAFHLISFIPFFKSLNRIGGVLLGAAEGLLTLGVLIYVIAKFLPDSAFVTETLNKSAVAHYLVFAAQWLIRLLPSAFDNIRTIF